MRPLLLAGHVFGFILWLGGGVAAMQIGALVRSAGREESALLLGLLLRIHRSMLLPGALLTVITGLLLTLQLYGGAVSAAGYPMRLMVMQGAGLLGAAIAVGITFPTVTRLARLDPTSPTGSEPFRRLRTRVSVSGMLSGILGMIALIAGVYEL